MHPRTLIQTCTTEKVFLHTQHRRSVQGEHVLAARQIVTNVCHLCYFIHSACNCASISAFHTATHSKSAWYVAEQGRRYVVGNSLSLLAQVCADTLIGDDQIRGVSGGQRKRVTTGQP